MKLFKSSYMVSVIPVIVREMSKRVPHTYDSIVAFFRNTITHILFKCQPICFFNYLNTQVKVRKCVAFLYLYKIQDLIYISILEIYTSYSNGQMFPLFGDSILFDTLALAFCRIYLLSLPQNLLLVA